MLTLVLAPIFQQRQLYIQRVVAIYLYTLLLANLSPSVRLSGPATDSGLNIAGYYVYAWMTIRGVLIIFTFPLTWLPINASAKLFPATIEDVVYWISTDTALLWTAAAAAACDNRSSWAQLSLGREKLSTPSNYFILRETFSADSSSAAVLGQGQPAAMCTTHYTGCPSDDVSGWLSSSSYPHRCRRSST